MAHIAPKRPYNACATEEEFMASEVKSDEVFDEEELVDDFDEEIVSEEELEDVVEAIEAEEADDVDDVVVVALVEDDEVVATAGAVAEDDDEAPLEVDPTLDTTEAILPKQDDEFRCKSCRLLKKTSQLADKVSWLCRDCV